MLCSMSIGDGRRARLAEKVEPGSVGYPANLKGLMYKPRRAPIPKDQLRAEGERLIKEALARRSLTVTQGQTRIETKCGKCGAINRVMVDPGQIRVLFKCKECGEKQNSI
jgi:phage FluMu protein Com